MLLYRYISTSTIISRYSSLRTALKRSSPSALRYHGRFRAPSGEPPVVAGEGRRRSGAATPGSAGTRGTAGTRGRPPRRRSRPVRWAVPRGAVAHSGTPPGWGPLRRRRSREGSRLRRTPAPGTRRAPRGLDDRPRGHHAVPGKSRASGRAGGHPSGWGRVPVPAGRVVPWGRFHQRPLVFSAGGVPVSAPCTGENEGPVETGDPRRRTRLAQRVLRAVNLHAPCRMRRGVLSSQGSWRPAHSREALERRRHGEARKG